MPDESEREAEQERDMSILKSHCMQLGEHFDTVQIFVTRHNGGDDDTTGVAFGHGNWFARYGQVKDYIVKSDRRIQREVENEE